MPEIMAPKFISNSRQALESSSKKRLITLALVLLALPVTVVLALTQQSFINRASGPEIAKVEVSPGIIKMNINDEPIQVSALAYNSSNVPVEGNVQYAWNMSSSNTVGTLTNVVGNVVEFKPLNYGCGQLTVSASYNGVVTKSISVVISDGVNVPNCAPPNSTKISKIEVSPGIISADINEGEVHVSALAYDSANNPITNSVTYEWSMSSANSVGTLSQGQGQLVKFYPEKLGCGELTIIARSSDQVVTKSIGVIVRDGFNLPTCAPAPTRPLSPTGVATPTLIPPTVTGTPTPAPQLLNANLKAIADSFVRGGRSSKNYGTKTFLATHDGKNMISYMKFDLRSMQGKEIRKATLKFKVLNKWKSRWAPSRNNQNLLLVGNNWTERGLTNNNKPQVVSPITTFKGDSYGKTLTLDVSDVVDQEKGGYISFSINSDGNDMMAIYSRESNNQKPTLLIEYY